MSGNLLELQHRIKTFANSVGIQISEAHSILLSHRCSSEEGALEYYLSNCELFLAEEEIPPPPEISLAHDTELLGPPVVGDDELPTAKPAVEVITPLSVVLQQYGFTDSQIEFALQRCSSVAAAVQLLTDSAPKAEEKELFCCICLDDHPISEMITLSCLPVEHRQGRECFASYCANHIMDGNIEIKCPEANCNTLVTVFELQASLNSEMFARYELFSTRAFCEDQKLRRCPKCNEWYVDVTDILNTELIWKSIKCEKCEHTFCGKCGQRPHKGQTEQDVDCTQFSEWLRLNEAGDESFDQFLRDERIFPCPQCGMPGELIKGGCKFLYCRCKANFCALCGVRLNESQHYSHFKDAPGCTGPFGEGCKGVTDSSH